MPVIILLVLLFFGGQEADSLDDPMTFGECLSLVTLCTLVRVIFEEE